MRGFQATISFRALLALGFLGAMSGLAPAQVVQLPSTRSLSYSGSVWVPDGGTADLGGFSSAYSSRSGATGMTTSNVGEASLSASVQIIDLAALDEAILAAASPRRTTGPGEAGLRDAGPVGSSAATLEGTAATVTASVDSVPERPQRNSRPATDLSEPISTRMSRDTANYLRVLAGAGDVSGPAPSQAESAIRYYVGQGEQAESAGRVIAARVFYRMARDLMTPELVAHYQRIVAERRAAEEARINAELDATRRKF